MAKRRVTVEQLREIIRARLTKGSAFSMNNMDYEKYQTTTKEQLATLDKEQLLKIYSAYTYDVQ